MSLQNYESFTSEIEALELQAQGENLDALIHNLPLHRVKNVLEVGCGSGAITRMLARFLGPEARVSGIDISEEHIQYGQQVAESQGISNVTLSVGDVLDDKIVDALVGNFDLVYCRYVLMYMIPKELERACLSQMIRCTRPGGKVVCIEPDVNFGQERFPAPPDRLSQVLSRLVPCYRNQRLIEWRSGIQIFYHMTLAGLSEVRVKLIDGRIIQGGAPKQLVQHGSKDVEQLLRPCLKDIGISENLVGQVVRQWCEYLGRHDNFIYTPIFMGVGNVKRHL